jgi:hypothetical protein
VANACGSDMALRQEVESLLGAHDAAGDFAGEDALAGLTTVELRYFAGMSEDEIATALGVSRSSITREWQMARAWLYRRLTTGAVGP